MKGTIIARGGLPLRKAPKTGAVIRSLRRNSRVEILEKETWLRVRTSDGKQGFVLADFVETAPEDLFPPARPSARARARRSTRSRSTAVRMASVVTAKSVAAQPLSEICDIRIYRNTRFIGAELRADADFFPSLDLLNQFATACNLEIRHVLDARAGPKGRRRDRQARNTIKSSGRTRDRHESQIQQSAVRLQSPDAQ
jgi:hypothetical protein